MDWNRVEGNWKQAKGKIKEQWGKLTDDDLDQINGRREQLEGKIQERYGIEKTACVLKWMIGTIARPGFHKAASFKRKPCPLAGLFNITGSHPRAAERRKAPSGRRYSGSAYRVPMLPAH